MSAFGCQVEGPHIGIPETVEKQTFDATERLVVRNEIVGQLSIPSGSQPRLDNASNASSLRSTARSNREKCRSSKRWPLHVSRSVYPPEGFAMTAQASLEPACHMVQQMRTSATGMVFISTRVTRPTHTGNGRAARLPCQVLGNGSVAARARPEVARQGVECRVRGRRLEIGGRDVRPVCAEYWPIAV